MVLDINVKKFKYSSLKKILCILICAVTLLGSISMGINLVFTFEYCGGEEVTNFTESQSFRHYFTNDVIDRVSAVTEGDGVQEHKNDMERHRKDAVDDIYKQYISLYNSEFSGLSYDEILNYDLWTYDFTYNVQSVYNSFDFYVTVENLTSDIGMPLSDEKEIKDRLNSLYDQFIANSTDDVLAQFYSFRSDAESFKYHVEYKSTVTGNIDKFNENDIYTHDIYYALSEGKVKSHGLSKDTLDTIENYLKGNKYIKQVKLYAYLDIPEESTYTTKDFLNINNIVDYVENYDVYAGIKEFESTAIKYQNNFVLYAIFTVLLMIISFVAAFRYFLVAGRKDEDAYAKLAFIDYIPFEIHLGISVALGVGASFLFMVVTKNLYPSVFSDLYFSVLQIYALAIWLLTFEFCASVARYARSEKKFYKGFLTYHIFRLLFIIIKKLIQLVVKIIKAIIQLDIKIIKAIGRSCKRTGGRFKKLFNVLTYAPKKFARNVILLVILYVVCNLLALLLLALVYVWAFAWYELFPIVIAAILTLADLGINIYLFIKFLDYIKKLDMIITAAANHEDINLDFNKLPKSLRTLAEAMRYTNAQLQNAVAKAVKDERLKTELITNVSHDLKTPLTSIITYVDLLSKCDIQDEKAQEYIKVLESRGAKLKRLIEDLIEASKVTSGNITVNRSNLNLYELCLQATVDAQPDFEKAGLELIVKENNNPSVIFADGPKSFRVIENLLSNARKYSAKASRVYVNVYEERGMGIFEIKNVSAQPLDISPDELTERFVRGDKSRNQEGNGLGLSIAKELCKAQNGDLEIIIDGDLFKAKAKLPLAK